MEEPASPEEFLWEFDPMDPIKGKSWLIHVKLNMKYAQTHIPKTIQEKKEYNAALEECVMALDHMMQMYDYHLAVKQFEKEKAK
jgi:hypothetical protein